MILSDNDIRSYMRRRLLRISPRPTHIGPGSVDLTLSNEFWRFKKKIKGGKVDLAKTNWQDITEKITTGKIELKPGEMILGKTSERITLPNNLAGVLEGRSSFARLGLAIHVTSSYIQPGSDNHQVLEIVNLAPYTIILRAGMRVSQVIFEELVSPTSKPYRKVGKVARKQ